MVDHERNPECRVNGARSEGNRRRLSIGRVLAWLAVCVPLSGSVGCGKSATDNPARTAAQTAARSEVERGPVRLVLEVAPREARLSDDLTLTVSIDHEPGIRLHKPPFDDRLGPFLVRDFREPLPVMQGKREVVRQVYVLEPTDAGEFRIGPMSVTFTDARPNGDGKEHTIETESVQIKIASAVPSEFPSLDELHPPAGPVELPQSHSRYAWWLLGAGLFIAGAVLAVWRRRRRWSSLHEREPTPIELAELELQKLEKAGYRHTDVKAYYVELTGIVRRFIERTTGVHAPEQTTEEFLREISNHTAFGRREQDQLRDFLESADLVKFAGFDPQADAVAESFTRARIFVGLAPQGAHE